MGSARPELRAVPSSTYSPSRTPRRDLYPGYGAVSHQANLTTSPLVACTTASTVQYRCPGLPVSKTI